MKKIHSSALAVFLLAGALVLLACAPSPNTAPLAATTAPTIVTPTTAPPTAAPTIAPTTAPTAASTPVGTPEEIIAAALEKLAGAEAFRLAARTELSPLFFQGEYTPLPGEDPDMVNLFTIEGEQNGSDLQYALSGFLASFIGLFTGFDPDANEIEIAEVDGTRYMRGTLNGAVKEQWYILSEEPGQSSSFAPQDMVSPMTEAAFDAESFSKTGTETIGAETCDVYSGSRGAFDAVFPGLVSAALLNEETLDLESIDETEFTLTICPDGNVYRIVYNFQAHSKTDPAETGTFTFETEVADFGGDISITAPPGAIPMPAPAGALTPEPDATPTTAITTVFTTLNGEWEGIIGEDNLLSFTVEDNVVTYTSVNYAVNTGGCSSSGVLANSVDDGEIQDSEFTVVMTDSDDVEFTLHGAFETNNAAAGTLNIRGTTFCGETDTDLEWTAQHISSPDAAADAAPTTAPTTAPTRAATTAPTRAPTVAPTRTPTTQPSRTPAPPTPLPTTSVDGVKLISDAFAAFAARDLNTALANVSDNVAFNIGGTTGVGKAALQSNMQLALTFGATFSVSDIKQVENLVTFTTTVQGIRAGTYTNSSALIQDGKITVFNIN